MRCGHEALALCGSGLQVQGQALLPGAAMFDMASSAATTLRQPVSADSTSPVALLRVTIPAPLPLRAAASGGAAWAAGAVLSVAVDADTGRLTVASQQAPGAAHRLHLAASSGRVLPQTAVRPVVTAPPARALAALVAWGPAATVGAATADIVQPEGGQSSQYTVHPTVLDCTTQVSSSRAASSGAAGHT